MTVPAFLPGIGLPELIVVLVIVLIIFGPKKLPEIGKALGSTVRELRKSSQKEDDATDTVSAEAKAEEPKKEEITT